MRVDYDNVLKWSMVVIVIGTVAFGMIGLVVAMW